VVKTGFIGRTDLLAIILVKLQQYHCRPIVIDPVLVNHRGQPMFPDEVRHFYLNFLLPMATLVTPNYYEAAVLLNTAIPDNRDLQKLAGMCDRLHQSGAQNIFLKGGQAGEEMVDLFYDGQQLQELRSPRMETGNTHGAGDTLSAAVCVALARGEEMGTAVYLAHQFTAQAIQNSATWQLGAGHGPVFAH
jgi:hydroxymethylpyrimidine/phosphomethylpyrimidine kinase